MLHSCCSDRYELLNSAAAAVTLLLEKGAVAGAAARTKCIARGGIDGERDLSVLEVTGDDDAWHDVQCVVYA